jgi:succinyl-diaminopimelate desuccinylase
MGCDEESGMRDVPYYLSHNAEPLFGFTPDVDFPVSHGEKGVYFGGNFVSAPVFSDILHFSGGFASNAIPARASCLIRAGERTLNETDGITIVRQNDDLLRVDAQGIGGHAAVPDGSVNAIGILVNFLLDNKIGNRDERLYLELLQKLHCDSYGSALDIACSSEKLGRLTCIGGMISQGKGVIRQDINIRYPECVTDGELFTSLSKIARAHNAQFEEGIIIKPFYIKPESFPIQLLLSTYVEISGRSGKPYTMGGGTYARCFRNVVGYGPGEDNGSRPWFVGSDHTANEGTYFPSLKKALKIYILALWRLQQLSLEDFAPERV